MRPRFSPFNFLRGIASAAFAAAGSYAAGSAAVPRNRVVVITGSSSGLGLALAHRYGKSGARLVLAARKSDDLEDAKDELLRRGSVRNPNDILLVSCDVSLPEQAANLIQSAITYFGRIDVLINNAGIIQVGPVETQTIEAFQQAMQTNFFGAVHTIHSVLPHMLDRRAGKIVTIASIGGKFAMPHLLPYVASKFALVGYSEGLHSELRHKGVRVTTVCPGLMRTGSHTHATFTGDAKAERRWFRLAATTPIIAASVKRAANQIFAAELAGRAEITITPQAWLAARFTGATPETMQIVASYINQFILPNSPTSSQPQTSSIPDPVVGSTTSHGIV